MKNNIFKRMVCMLLAMVMVLSCAPVSHAHHHGPDAIQALPGAELMRTELSGKLNAISGFDPNEEVTFLVELEGKALLDSKPADKTVGEHLTASDAQRRKLDKEQKAVRGRLDALENVAVTQTYQVVLNGFAVQAKRSAEAELRSIPGVKRVSVAEFYEYAAPTGGYVSAEHISGGKMDTDLAAAEGYTGKGTVTAILDTGLDVNHEAFQTQPAEASFTKEDVAALVRAGALQADVDADSLYKSAKVPFAFDYADWDSNVYDVQQHGTHVAGSVGANCDHLTGVAPDTQLVILKVFSDTQNGASSAWIFAGLEDAVVLGVDTINMSLGSGSGFSSDSVADEVYAKVKAAGINLMVSAGNDTDSTYGTNLGVNLPLISEPDNGIVGSPSTYAAAMSVASVNEDAIFQTYLLAGDRHIIFSDSNTDHNNFVETLDGQTLEYVWVPGLGAETDYQNIDVKGKIALVVRGELSFSEKEANAVKAGAKAMIVYNNEDNAALISMAVDGTIPSVFISKEDGNYLRGDLQDKKISISTNYMEYIQSTDNGYMSDFSSIGVTPDLKLKPEITAPGGYVYSTLPDGTYGVMSGTSMASPHMAGAASVVRQYVNETYPQMTDLEKQSYINTVLMNTAIPVLDEYGVAYTPRKQGAGLANLYNAIHTGAYVTVDGSDRPKADLGHSPDGDFTKNVTLTIHNTSDAELSYDLSVLALTAQQTTALGNDGVTYDVISNYARVMPEGELAVTFSEDTVTVAPGGTKSVNVKLQLTAAGKAALADFVNGTFLDGFIQLKSEDGIDLTVPYMGFYGDWGKPEVFDDSIYGEETASVYPSAMALFSIYDGSGFYLGTNLMADEDSELYDVFDADKVAYSSKGYYGRNYYYNIFSVLGLLRAPEKLTYTITTADGQEIYRNVVEHEMKSFLTSSSYINYAMGPDPSNGWEALIEESDGTIYWVDDGDYTLTIDAQVAGTDTVQTTSFPLSVDNQMPKVTETRYYVVDDVPYIDISMTDNNYLMAYQVITADGENALAAAEVVGEETKGAITTVTYELSAVQEAGYKTARVAMYDYALNYAESDLFSVVSEFIEADTVTIINQGLTASGDSNPFIIEAMIEPAIAKDKTLVWASSDPEVASVEALGTTRVDEYTGIVYYQAMLTPHNKTGDATITATATNGVSGSTTIHVTAVDDTHEHTYGDWVETIPATCTEEGLKTRSCTICGESETAPIPATGHSFGDWTVTTEPSCTEGGEQTRSCHCGETETEALEALGHDYVAVVTPPTEEAGGYTTHTCSRCGDSYVDSYTDPLPPAEPGQPIPEDFTIREDGTYEIGAVNRQVIITDNAREVKLVFAASAEAPYTELNFVSKITDGLHVTIEGLNASMGTTYSSKVPFLDFQGKGNVLTISGTNTLTSLDNSYMSKALIRVAVGTELTINGTGTLNIDHGGMNPSAAIGSNSGESAGTIIIDGGTLNIVNKGSGAAIGGASSRTAEKLVVNGGVLNLTCEFYQGAYSNNITNNGAGIGTGNYVSGYDYVTGTQNKPPVIEINGGTITGVTNTGAPIIGTCASSSIGTNITINGGVLDLTANATSSSTDAGACIGTARSVSGTPSITINGGEIHAVTNSYAAAIGSGPNSKAGTVYIYGGTVTAVSTNTQQAIAAIGPGYYGTAGNVWISGGSVKAESASTDGIVTSSAIVNADMDPVSPVAYHMPGVQSVSVNHEDWKVSANHPEDEFVYLWLTEGEHEVTSVDDHDECFVQWNELTAATCTEEGLEESTCATCGEVRTRIIPAAGHSYEAVVTEPSCTEGGYTTHTCSRCGDSYVDSYTEATGHSFGDWVVTTEPGCTEAGEETRTCHCGEIERRSVEALGHDYEAEVIEPSCTEGGYTVHTCWRCGDSYVDSYTEATGHSFGSWVVTTEPSCTEEGEETRTCHCGETQKRPVAPYCPSSIYEDVPKGNWYHDAVDYVTAAGLMNGMSLSHFAPNVTTSRAMMATLLYRLAGSPDVSGLSNPFRDVNGQWYHDAVVWAYHAGVVNGQSQNLFNPNGDVQRQEMVVMLYRYEGTPYADTSVLETFADGSKVYSYAEEAFAWAIEEGLVNGMEGNTLQPKSTATRAQIATILSRYLQK